MTAYVLVGGAWLGGTDVVNLIEFEDLRDVVLLGHSYAGLVVTGAADRISTVVHLDTGRLPMGSSS